MQQSVHDAAGGSGERYQPQQQHPAWLQHEINKANARKQQGEQHEQQQERKHQRVTQQAAMARDRIRHPLPPQPLPQHTVAFIDNHRPATATPHGRPQSGRLERGRPKWAMTAAQEEADMEAECEELVGFVEQLDYQSWMDDMDDRQAKRAEEEKESEQAEEQQEKAAQIETLGDGMRQGAASEWDESLPRPPTGIRPPTQSTQSRPHTALISRPHTARPSTSPPAAADTTATLVATLLHSSATIRNIHSSHSLRALISSAHSSRTQQHGTTVAAANSVSVAIPEPLVSVVATRDTMHGKIYPSLLPYLHRHPAV